MNPTGPRNPLETLFGSLRLGRGLRLVWQGSRRLTVVSLVLVVFAATIPLAILYLTKLVVDAITAGVQEPSTASYPHVLLLIGLMVGAGLVGSLLGVLAGLVNEAHAHRVTDGVLETIHRKSVEMDLQYYEDPAYQDSLHLAQQEAPYRPSAVLSDLLRVIQSGLTLVGIIGLIATMHWLLAILLFVAVLPALVVRIRHADRYFHWQERQVELQRRSNYLSWLLLYEPPAKEIRLFHLGRVLTDRFRDLRERLRLEQLGLARDRSLGDAGVQLVGALAVFGAFAYIAWRTYQGGFSIGDLVMYFVAVQRGQSQMQALFAGLGSLYEDNLFLARLEDFMEVEPRVVAPPAPRSVPKPIREGIRFEGVWFRYPGSSRPLLEGVDLAIDPGEVVALVGANGAGKTTIVKLLCRLYDPVEGRITIDGADLREFRPDDLRREISVVFQDFFRYFLPARDNIWFGDVDRPVDDPGIREASVNAGADGFLRALRHGYETDLGRLWDEGEELSTGEWQKIALARGFFREAQLLVVDEPTSALDAVAEVELFQTLRKLVRGRATLLISHRFSTVRMADRIYVIDDGRIVESGTHEVLLAQNGSYARLYSLQAAAYSEEGVSVPHPFDRHGGHAS